MKRRKIVTGLALGLLLAACGSADSPATTTPTTTTMAATTTTAATPSVVEVEALDYGFAGLPDTAAAGTEFTLLNTSDGELHELVAIRLPDDETRSVADLVADPDALRAYFPNVATVVIAPPNEMGFPVEGTGVLSEPGRYAIICAIPVGADPAEYMAAAAESEGPPQVEGGPPHFVEGMFGEVTITE